MVIYDYTTSNFQLTYTNTINISHRCPCPRPPHCHHSCHTAVIIIFSHHYHCHCYYHCHLPLLSPRHCMNVYSPWSLVPPHYCCPDDNDNYSNPGVVCRRMH